MSQENVELVRKLYAEWEKGRFWSMTEVYAPDVEWQWSRQARMLRSGSATYRGLAEIGAAMREWVSEWGLFRLSPAEFIDAGDHVVVLSEVHAELKDERGEVHDRQADVITVHDGKIVRMETFDGRSDAMEALGLGEGAS
jgi:ketosteroid isomerase-like protein